MIPAVVQPLNLVVGLLLSCCFLLTSCHPTQMKSKTSQVAQLVLVSLSDSTTFNYAINDSPYSVLSFISRD